MIQPAPLLNLPQVFSFLSFLFSTISTGTSEYTDPPDTYSFPPFTQISSWPSRSPPRYEYPRWMSPRPESGSADHTGIPWQWQGAVSVPPVSLSPPNSNGQKFFLTDCFPGFIGQTKCGCCLYFSFLVHTLSVDFSFHTGAWQTVREPSHSIHGPLHRLAPCRGCGDKINVLISDLRITGKGPVDHGL